MSLLKDLNYISARIQDARENEHMREEYMADISHENYLRILQALVVREIKFLTDFEYEDTT